MSFSQILIVTTPMLGAWMRSESASQKIRAKCSMLGFSPSNSGQLVQGPVSIAGHQPFKMAFDVQ